MSYQLHQEEVKALTPDGSVNMPGLKTVVDLLGEAGDLAPPLPPPSKYVDESYLAKARGN
jgi:hypothetical protein